MAEGSCDYYGFEEFVRLSGGLSRRNRLLIKNLLRRGFDLSQSWHKQVLDRADEWLQSKREECNRIIEEYGSRSQWPPRFIWNPAELALSNFRRLLAQYGAFCIKRDAIMT